MLEINKIYEMEAREGLRQLKTESIDCVITSPPYWQTRDYGVGPTKWESGDESALGLERNCNDYILHLLEFFQHVHRVLKRTGTLWVNLGDSYGGQSTKVSHARLVRGKTSLLPRDLKYMPAKGHIRGRWGKSLMAVPERFVLGMLDQGWILRNRIVWHKTCHMPQSVKDRFTTSWEHLFFFVKSRRYWFNLDAVREPHTTFAKHPYMKQKTSPRGLRLTPNIRGAALPPNPGQVQAFHPNGRNPGDYWSMPSETRSLGAILGQNGAVKFPGGSGWTGHWPGGQARMVRENDKRWLPPHGKNPGDCWDIVPNNQKRVPTEHAAHFAVFPEKLCERPILSGCPPKGIVLDPFIGSGTTAVVARRLGRNFIGFELNRDYVRLAQHRLAASENGGVAAAA